ncbi:MFS transporter [Streptomyces sp. NPDC086766]|uniref:MFS transporter n=1 Tax=Streptomyces sp. NPDC086766 TaxID=3365754 RepID=UPI0037FB3A7E
MGSTAAPPPPSSAQRAGAFTAVSIALFCIQVDFFALNPAVPGIASDLRVTVSAAQWTLSAYMLAIGCFFIVGGRLGDLFGRRPLLLTGMALFTAGCALAPTLDALVAARDETAPRQIDLPGCLTIVTVFLATLQLQQVRGLSALAAGAVFLVPALTVACTGPLGAWLSLRMSSTTVMALAGLVAGTGMTGLSLVWSWWLYVPLFTWCALGLGLGWTFASVATQQVVPPARAGEASGVVLTALVTLGAVALAATATAVTALTPETGPAHAYDAILRTGGAIVLEACAAVLFVRHRLAVRGLVPSPVGSADPADVTGSAGPVGRRRSRCPARVMPSLGRRNLSRDHPYAAPSQESRKSDPPDGSSASI